jgi:hypothetical protein
VEQTITVNCVPSRHNTIPSSFLVCTGENHIKYRAETYFGNDKRPRYILRKEIFENPRYVGTSYLSNPLFIRLDPK